MVIGIFATSSFIGRIYFDPKYIASRKVATLSCNKNNRKFIYYSVFLRAVVHSYAVKFAEEFVSSFSTAGSC